MFGGVGKYTGKRIRNYCLKELIDIQNPLQTLKLK